MIRTWRVLILNKDIQEKLRVSTMIYNGRLLIIKMLYSEMLEDGWIIMIRLLLKHTKISGAAKSTAIQPQLILFQKWEMICRGHSKHSSYSEEMELSNKWRWEQILRRLWEMLRLRFILRKFILTSRNITRHCRNHWFKTTCYI